jgi:hypothetical protein
MRAKERILFLMINKKRYMEKQRRSIAIAFVAIVVVAAIISFFWHNGIKRSAYSASRRD